MDAQIGDHIIIRSKQVGVDERSGEIVEILPGPAGQALSGPLERRSRDDLLPEQRRNRRTRIDARPERGSSQNPHRIAGRHERTRLRLSYLERSSTLGRRARTSELCGIRAVVVTTLTFAQAAISAKTCDPANRSRLLTDLSWASGSELDPSSLELLDFVRGGIEEFVRKLR